MNRNHFSKILYAFYLFVLVACQSQTVVTATVPTTVPKIIPTNPAIVYPITTPDAIENIGQVVATVPLKSKIVSIVYGFDSIWVTHPSDGVVARIDEATNTVLAEIIIGTSTGDEYYPTPGGLTVTKNRVWTTITNKISNNKSGQSKLVGIDPNTNEVVEEIMLGGIEYPNITVPFKAAWAITSDGDTIWLADFNYGVVARVDTLTKQVVATITKVDYVTELIPFDGSIWAVLHRNDGIARIDPTTNTVIATIPLPLEEQAPSTFLCSWCVNAITVGDGSVWISLGLAKAIARIDPETNQVVEKINLEAYGAPFYYQGDLWSTVSPESCNDSGGHEGYLTRIDPKTNTLVGKIPLDCPGYIVASEDSLWVDTVSASGDFSLVRIEPVP